MKSFKEIFSFFMKKKEVPEVQQKERKDHSLDRFICAQEKVYERALGEVKNGKVVSRWMWYVFPQLKGEDKNNNSIYYGLDNIEEARAYLAHPILGERLREITTLVLQSEKSVDEIFDSENVVKLRSCMKLFNQFAEDDIFAKMLNRCNDKRISSVIDDTKCEVCLLGAIAGDMIGSVYEFFPHKNTDFPLFNEYSDYTDDTVMTVANAEWLLVGDNLYEILKDYGRRYPSAGYASLFKEWLKSDDAQPYNSWGNGSAMRVSPIGWAFETLDETLDFAKKSAEITHNHPEGIKGAQATAACIFMARKGNSKQEIKEYIEETFGYNLSRTCDEIRPTYLFDGSCQGTVPESIIAFLESTDFESAIRLTVSLGGDADTMGAITGAIAEAYYGGVPEYIKVEVLQRLPNEFISVIDRFCQEFIER